MLSFHIYTILTFPSFSFETRRNGVETVTTN